MKTKHLEYFVMPFKAQVIIVIADTVEKAVKEYSDNYQKLDIDFEDSKGTKGLTGFYLHDSIYYYYSLLTYSNIKEIGHLAHEAFHIVYAITRHYGLFLVPENEEYFAYEIQNLVNFIVKNK